ncbi:MAG TPA: DUF1080 domain-containing protein [Isosphaeraceae bacterium]|jgi:hypothetical protein|nr:DUF1080 domain-containing protein [Isosphaeraceae bacterium]
MNARFRAWTVLLLVAAPLAFARAQDDEKDGWSDLLKRGGPELKGWTRLTIPPKGKLNPKSQWSYDPSTGLLTCRGDGGHEWLRWDEPLGDFVYHVEWRFVPVEGKKGYNSGVYVRNSDDATVWHQAQTGDASGGFLFGETRRDGKLSRFNLSNKLLARAVRPAGEWNTFEITCKGKDVTLRTNGEVTNEWHDCPVASGHVGLEAEGWRIEFRNVKVKAIESSK